MDLNQTVDNDLQKAIDDITNNTNTDPVFSDPIAAPSPTPEINPTDFDAPINNFSEPQIETVTQFDTVAPVAPLDPTNTPEEIVSQDLSIPQPAPLPTAPIAEPAIEPAPIAPEPITTAPITPEPIAPEPITPPAPIVPEPVIPEPIVPEPITPPAPIAPEPIISTTIESAPSTSLNTRQVKEAALRDLIPLLNRLSMTSSQKFNICRNIFEDLRDYTVLEQAYHAATEIADATERAEALLYIVESIDKM